MIDSLLESHPNNPAGVSLQQQVRRELSIHRLKEKKMARSIFDKLDADPRSSSSSSTPDSSSSSSSSSSQGRLSNLFHRVKNIFSSSSSPSRENKSSSSSSSSMSPFDPSLVSRLPQNLFNPSSSSSSPFASFSDDSTQWMKLLQQSRQEIDGQHRQGREEEEDDEGRRSRDQMDVMQSFLSSMCKGGLFNEGEGEEGEGKGRRRGGGGAMKNKDFGDQLSSLYQMNNDKNRNVPWRNREEGFPVHRSSPLFPFLREDDGQSQEQLEKNMRDLQTLLELNQQFLGSDSEGGRNCRGAASSPLVSWRMKLRFIWICCKFAGRALYERISMSCRRRYRLCKKRFHRPQGSIEKKKSDKLTSALNTKNREKNSISSSSSSASSSSSSSSRRVYEENRGGCCKERREKEDNNNKKKKNKKKEEST